MNDLAIETLARVQREAGATLDLIKDYDLVRDLVEASELALNSDKSPACEALLMPSLKVGNVVLYRLSHGARLFFEREILPVWKHKVDFCNIAYAYCMAVSKEPETLWRVAGDSKAIKKSIKAWERTVSVPSDLLIAGVDTLLQTVAELYQATGDEGNGKKGSDLGKWIAEIARETGRPIQDLMWNCPEEELIMLLTQRPNDEENADPDSTYIRSVRVFRESQTKIEAVLTERANNV